MLDPNGVAVDDREDVVEVVRDAAGESAQALHFLRLNELLLEPLSLRIVKEIALQLRRVPLGVEAAGEACGHIDGVAVALVHLELVALDVLVRPHLREQVEAFLFRPQEREEIRLLRFLDRIETKDPRERRIAGHDRAVRFHDQVAGEIFIHETPVTLLAATKRFCRPHAIGDVGIDLEPGRVRFRVGQRPAACDHDLDPILAGLPQLTLPMVLGAKGRLEPAERFGGVGL